MVSQLQYLAVVIDPQFIMWLVNSFQPCLCALHICVDVQAYSELKPGQREGSVLHEPVMQLLQETTQPLSHMRKKSPERIQFYPQLASAFSLLLRTNPPSNTANLSKCVWMYAFSACLRTCNGVLRSLKVAGFFSDTFCSDEALHSAVSKPSIVSVHYSSD